MNQGASPVRQMMLQPFTAHADERNPDSVGDTDDGFWSLRAGRDRTAVARLAGAIMPMASLHIPR
jgi:hypothetical protein